MLHFDTWCNLKRFNDWKSIYRLADEGYTAAENPVATPVQTIVAPIIESMTLKELGDIIDEGYIKVI